MLVSEKAGATALLFGTVTDPATGVEKIKDSMLLGNGAKVKLGGGGMRTASLTGIQTDSLILIITALLGSIKYGMDIAKFFNEKFSSRNDIKIRVGNKLISTQNKDDLQKAIDEEIELRLKEGNTNPNPLLKRLQVLYGSRDVIHILMKLENRLSYESLKKKYFPKASKELFDLGLSFLITHSLVEITKDKKYMVTQKAKDLFSEDLDPSTRILKLLRLQFFDLNEISALLHITSPSTIWSLFVNLSQEGLVTSSVSRSYSNQSGEGSPIIHLTTKGIEFLKKIDSEPQIQGKDKLNETQRDGKRSLTPAEKTWVWENKPRQCYICGKDVEKLSDAHFDHTKAHAKRGKTTPANSGITHNLCNKLKGKKSLAEIQKYLGTKSDVARKSPSKQIVPLENSEAKIVERDTVSFSNTELDITKRKFIKSSYLIPLPPILDISLDKTEYVSGNDIIARLTFSGIREDEGIAIETYEPSGTVIDLKQIKAPSSSGYFDIELFIRTNFRVIGRYHVITSTQFGPSGETSFFYQTR